MRFKLGKPKFNKSAIIKAVRKAVINYLPIWIFTAGFCIWFYLILISPLTREWPVTGRYNKAYFFYSKAIKFSPNHIQGKRYREIYKAILKGSNDYKFDTNLSPPVSGNK